MYKIGLMRSNSNLKAIVFLSLLALWLLPMTFSFTQMATEISITPVTTPTPADKLGFGVTSLLTQGSTPVNVIVATTTNDYSQISALIEELGGTVTIEYTHTNAIAVAIPANTLLELAASPLVVTIYQDTMQYLQASKSAFSSLDLLTTSDPGLKIEPITIENLATIPSTYTNNYYTLADLIWDETGFGMGTSVAIIDTGCWVGPWVDPDYGIEWYPWYWDAVYDGVDISFDVGTTYEGYGNPMNHFHGTACADLIAANVLITFGQGHPWGESIAAFDPEGTWIDTDGNIHCACLGIAPFTSIYAVKVFDHTGGGVPSSMVMQGLDLAIEEGVDVISMSLGGVVGAPGSDPTDLLVDAATALGITVVVSAGNEGPAPLRVGSPGTAKTAITVGAAADPIHERVFAGIVWGIPVGPFYYPSEDFTIADFSCRGPTSDGRIKPDVVATGSWLFFEATPQEWPYTIHLGGGTSFSCPQVAGEAALLTAYIKNNGLDLGPKEIKKAIMEGAVPIDGYSAMEQGAGYINCVNSLELIKDMESECDCGCKWKWGHHFGKWWRPPIETLRVRGGKAVINDVTLEPGLYEYFAFWVGSQVDAIRITLSGVEFAPWEEQNPLFGDAGVLYLSSTGREGAPEYHIPIVYFFGDGVIQFSANVAVGPGLIRLVLAGDFSSYAPLTIEEVTIELVEVKACKWGRWLGIWNKGVNVDQAQVSIYDGTIEKHKGKIREGEIDAYSFTIPDETGFAFVELSWKLDWTKWATSDLDMVIIGPSGVNVEGASGASPEVTSIIGPGDYTILVDGYQVYWGKKEKYTLRIIYFANLDNPLWESEIFALDRCLTFVRLPRCKHGLAVIWIHDSLFSVSYMADYVVV